MERLTLIQCDLSDAAIGASLCGHHTAAQRDAVRDADRAERMGSGVCERCQEQTDTGLSLCAGEALCDACLGAELDEDPGLLDASTRLL